MGKISELLVTIKGHKIYVDTNIFVYFLERNTTFLASAAAVIQAIAAREVSGYTGEIAVAETMVGPYRTQNAHIIATTRRFFSTENFLTILPHDNTTLDCAAQLRALSHMKLIDALHVATALRAECTFLITNDKALRSTGSLHVLQLSGFS